MFNVYIFICIISLPNLIYMSFNHNPIGEIYGVAITRQIVIAKIKKLQVANESKVFYALNSYLF